MIKARFPWLRTNPAGFGVSGYWPVLTGILAILLVPPLFGLILILMSTLGSGDVSWTLEEIGIVLMWSPLFSWVALLGAIPISHFAARFGFAGWGVAAAGGILVGALMAAALDAVSPFSRQAFDFMTISVPFALLYWGAIRLIHPTAIGVQVRPETL